MIFSRSLHVASLQLLEIILCNKAVLKKIKDMKNKLNIMWKTKAQTDRLLIIFSYFSRFMARTFDFSQLTIHYWILMIHLQAVAHFSFFMVIRRVVHSNAADIYNIYMLVPQPGSHIVDWYYLSDVFRRHSTSLILGILQDSWFHFHLNGHKICFYKIQAKIWFMITAMAIGPYCHPISTLEQWPIQW